MKPQEIMSLLTKYQESRLFLTAAELDVFTLLEKNPISAREIADKLNATERGITILLNAVVSMGLLEKREGNYYCSDEVASLLSQKSKNSMIPVVRFSSGGWKRWLELTDIVLNGKEEIRGTAYDLDESEVDTFNRAMHAKYRIEAPSIVAAIQLGRAKKLLDIGGGSGAYTQAFLEASQDLTATIFELAPANKLPTILRACLKKMLRKNVKIILSGTAVVNMLNRTPKTT